MGQAMEALPWAWPPPFVHKTTSTPPPQFEYTEHPFPSGADGESVH
jgi:hypothetical protein